MDKTSLVLKMNECFAEEGCCVILHFVDGSDLLVRNKPVFNNLAMEVNLNYVYDNSDIVEQCFIPYASIMYITITTVDNLNKISKSYYNEN